MVPFAVQDPDRAVGRVQVFRQASAKASLMRRPARYSTTIKARLRMPVMARFEQARMRAFTSSGESGSGGSLRPLLAGTW